MTPKTNPDPVSLLVAGERYQVELVRCPRHTRHASISTDGVVFAPLVDGDVHAAMAAAVAAVERYQAQRGLPVGGAG